MIQTQCRRPVRRRVAYPLAGPNRSGALSRALEARGLGQVHREAVAPTLSAGHFRQSVAELLLDVAFVELDRSGKLLGRQPGQRPKSDRLAPKVLALVDAGRSYRLIGRELGLSKNTVGDIVKRRRALNAGSSVP